VLNGLIVLSTALLGFFFLRKSKNTRSTASRILGFSVIFSGLGYVFQQIVRQQRNTRCEDDLETGIRRCREYEQRGYAVCAEYEERSYQACSEYEDRGYQACSEYEDRGYQTCSAYEDRGYNSCAEWRKNCCDWWPCSWICEFFSWVCIAWVWVTNLVCVAWTWVSNLVCVAWYWVTNLVCVAWTWVTTFFCTAWYWVSTLVCIAWTVVTFPVCWLTCFIRRLFASNEVSFARSECIYGWTAAYRIVEQDDCRLQVVVRIRLVPDTDVTAAQLQNAMDVWEPAIEQAWTDQWAILRERGGCECREYQVSVDVQWVDSGEHHTVAVHSGNGRADMGNWFINNTGGTAAHEVGHMLGNVDEYTDANCPNRVITTDNSIMRNSQTGTVRPRHYQGFANWISNRTCCDYVVATS